MVEQVDREAAAAICTKEHIKRAVLSGEADDAPGIMAFAAHRLAAEKAERERIADWLDIDSYRTEFVERAKELEAERDRLAAMVEKLRGYAVHRPWCGIDMHWAGCTCGLSDVVKESENG